MKAFRFAFPKSITFRSRVVLALPRVLARELQVGISCWLSELLPKFAMMYVEARSTEFSPFYKLVHMVVNTKPFADVNIKV